MVSTGIRRRGRIIDVWAKKSSKVVWKSLLDFFSDDGLMLAGSMSFFFMTALIPYCLFLLAIFGYFLGEHADFFRFFLEKLISLFPKVTHVITEELTKIIIYREIGNFTLFLYGVLSFQLFSSLDMAINRIFGIHTKRPFVVSLVFSLTVITVIIALFLVSFSASSAVAGLETLKKFVPALRIGKLIGFIIRFIIPLVLVFLVSSMLYFLLPRKRVTAVHAFSGALFTSCFLEAAKHVFTFYVVRVVDLGTIYGPFSAFIIFLLWLFYSSCIFLIGAEIVKNLQHHEGEILAKHI